MTLKDFDYLMQLAHEAEQCGRRMKALAQNTEAKALKLAGVEHVDREAGFACWRIDGVAGWFNDPRDAVEAKEKQGGAT